MKKILFLLLSVLLFSCSSKDDDPKVTDFTLNVSEIIVSVDDTFEIEQKVISSADENRIENDYVSENENIAKVIHMTGSTAIIFGVNEGETFIKVSYNDVTKRVKVIVKPRTLEKYYERFSFGCKIKDTTGLKIMCEIYISNNKIYLAGLKNKKLWISQFNEQTKEPLGEFLDTEEFDLNKKIDIGYGKFQDLNITKFRFKSVYENNNGCVAYLGLLTYEEYMGLFNNFDLLIFNESNNTKKYYTPAKTYSLPLRKWYNNTYISRVDPDQKTIDKYIYTCFDGKGDVIATTQQEVLLDNIFPTNYDSYVYINEGYTMDPSDNNSHHRCVNIIYNEFSLSQHETPKFSENFFYKNVKGEREFIFDVQYLELKNNVLTFKINLTFKSGTKESHKYEFNTKSLTIKEI